MSPSSLLDKYVQLQIFPIFEMLDFYVVSKSW